MGLTILLVRPKPHKDSIGLHKFMVCEPLELEYLSASLTQSGHSVDIIDMLLEPAGKLMQRVDNVKPDMVGFTAYMPHVAIVRQYARRIKESRPEIVTVVGGVHAEVNPTDFEDPAIDYIVKVNGLKTMVALADSLVSGGIKETLKKEIEGIWSGPEKPYEIDPIREFPFPDRKKTGRYRRHYNYIFHDQCATIKTSFGCPYRCEFCYCIEIARHRYSERSIDRVIEEIKTIPERNIFIVDDNFLVSLKRIVKFCALLDNEGIRKNFIMFGRADFIVDHPDIITLLKDHGLKAIFVGIESFKEAELTKFKKKTTVEINRKAIFLLDSLGIECYAGLIVDFDWQRKDFDVLIGFLKQFKMPFLNIQPATPIPGTALFEKFRDEIAIPRQAFHLWDMAHVLLRPAKMSERAFYWNIMRTYFKTSAGPKAHWYVLRKSGLRIYLRVLRGVLYIAWQYTLLVLKGGMPTR